MKKLVLLFVFCFMLVPVFTSNTFAEELKFTDKIGDVDPDSGDKLLDREIDDEFVKETYQCPDGSYAYNIRYKWELLENQKLIKEKNVCVIV